MTPTDRRRLFITCLLVAGLALGPAAGFAQPVEDSEDDGLRIERRVIMVNGDHHESHSFAYSTASRAYLGISMLELTPGLRRHFGTDDDSGVMISEIEADSPAALAGLEAGDILLSVEGDRVAHGHEVAAAIRPRSDGDTVALEVLRDGQSLSFSAILAERERPNIDVGAWAWTQDNGDRPLTLQIICEDDEDCPEHLEFAPEMFGDALSTLRERVESGDFQERFLEFHAGNDALEKRLKELEAQLADLQEQLERMN